ncbi:MAG: right-handed parallel beta-helix repeat-containing protein [Planctomycetaceae bacterium]|nr:right-handed parallel beta-helix repeat-containing protein [Planctomycetaceae bacterium]
MLKKISILTLFVILCSDIQAKQITVPKDFDSIQKAINNSDAEDVIIVRAGVYVEDLNSSRPLRIEGQNSESTIIKGTIKIKAKDFNSPGRNKTIIKNICIDASQTGIEACDCCDVLIENCIVKNANMYGIAILYSKKTEVKNCRVINGKKIGIYCNTINDLSLADNIAMNSSDPKEGSGFGIYYVKQCSVTNNRNINNKSTGMYLFQVSTSTIKNNKCNENGNAGIYLHNCGYSEISANEVMQNVNGIVAFRVECRIESNLCMNNAYNGIYVRASEESIAPISANGDKTDWSNVKTQIRNNYCINNKIRGIYLYYLKKPAVIEKNICEYNQNNGIEIDNSFSPVCIRENTVQFNARNGIDASNSTFISIEENTIKYNLNGISSMEMRDKVNVIKNSINNNYRDGIFICDAKASIESNIIENNKHEGIFVFGEPGSWAKVKGNILKENYRIGIHFVNGAAGEIIDNECTGHDWSGIAIRGKNTSPIVSGNKCFKNKCWGIAYWDDAKPKISDNVTENNGLGSVQYWDKYDKLNLYENSDF